MTAKKVAPRAATPRATSPRATTTRTTSPRAGTTRTTSPRATTSGERASKAPLSSAARTARTADATTAAALRDALAWLTDHRSQATLDGMARYAIPSHDALGVTMGNMKALGKRLGKNHDLALALWGSGLYEARVVASFVAEPARLTPEEMDRWCADFDSWAICDTVCFHLFDRTPHAWSKVERWARESDEFVKRAAFALLWGLTVHDKGAGDEPFVRSLAFVEREAIDERNFVKKAVNMALRAIGKRSAPLNAAAAASARRLAGSPHPVAQWVGKDALKELSSPAVQKRLGAHPRALGGLRAQERG